ncbi:hypothetical protein HK405_009941, partial [Cladochytrium tenue]
MADVQTALAERDEGVRALVARLAARLRAADADRSRAADRLAKLADDFAYNLQLLHDRDADLARLEKEAEALRVSLAEREADLAEAQGDLATKSRELSTAQQLLKFQEEKHLAELKYMRQDQDAKSDMSTMAERYDECCTEMEQHWGQKINGVFVTEALSANEQLHHMAQLLAKKQAIVESIVSGTNSLSSSESVKELLSLKRENGSLTGKVVELGTEISEMKRERSKLIGISNSLRAELKDLMRRENTCESSTQKPSFPKVKLNSELKEQPIRRFKTEPGSLASAKSVPAAGVTAGAGLRQ